MRATQILPGFFLLVILFSGNLSPQSAPQTAKQAPSGGAGNSPTAIAQQDAQSSPLALKVTTRLVMVSVVARDKKGHIVADLRAPDFQIKEDGQEQKLSVFGFHQPGTGEALSPVPVKLPPNVFRNTLRYEPNRALNVILLDALNTNLLNQAYVRVEMVKFLDKLPQGQPIAIFVMGRKLQMLQDFTTDLTLLKKVIQTAKKESSHVMSDPSGTSEVPMTLQGIADQQVAELAPQFKAQLQDFEQQNVSGQSDVRIQYTVAALTSLARMLAGYPGRKNLIWLSESIPIGIYPDVKNAIRAAPGSGGVADMRDQLGPDGTPTIRNEPGTRHEYVDQLTLLSNLLADAQVSVYPTDARGLLGPAFFNVSTPMNGQSGAGGLASRVEGRQAEELFQAHYNMRDIAEKTGGLAFYNRNDLDTAVRNGIDDGSTYYAIGYYPSNKDWNGQFRKIQIAVTRPGVKLRYRLGYFAVDRAEYGRLHPQQKDIDFSAALNPDYPISTAVQFEVGIIPPGPGETKIKVNYALDPHLLTFEQGVDGLQRAQIDCAVRVFRPKDISHPVRTEATRINATLKPEVYDKIGRTYFPCQLTFELEPGKYFLRLAVRDNGSGLLGSLNAEFTMPDVKATASTESQH